MHHLNDILIQIHNLNQVSELQAKVGPEYLSDYSASLLEKNLAGCVQKLILEYP